MDDELLARIEKQRLELEANIATLKKGLRYWQNLELDYQALIDEFSGLPDNASAEECFQRAHDAAVEEIDEKELKELIQTSESSHRKPSHLVEALTKRVEYVLRNTQTLRKQLSESEKKLNALLLARDPAHVDEAALPLTEIIEELDEDGNVISSKAERPANQVSSLSDVLKTAGVEMSDLPDSSKGAETQPSKDAEGNSSNASDTDFEDEAERATELLSGTFDYDASTKMLKPKPAPETRSDSPPSSAPMQPTNPNDTEEEARLRQEMLQYGLDEVGNIVAELDMAEGDATTDDEDLDSLAYSDSEEDEEFFDDDDEDDENSDNETGIGKTPRPRISSKYRAHMEALKASLGMQDIKSLDDMKNMGPSLDDLPQEIKDQLKRSEERQSKPAELARKAAIARDDASRSSMKSTSAGSKAKKAGEKEGKKVAFAPELDIAPEKPPSSTRQPSSKPSGNEIVKESVLERNTSSLTPTHITAIEDAPPDLPRKPSRFKSDRTSATTSLPIRGPPTSLTSPNVVERPISRATPIPPTDTNADDGADFDPALQQRQIAAEFHALHNKRVHDEGGYVGAGEEDNWGAKEGIVGRDVVDERTGERRKVSLFKARRLGG